MFYSKVLIAGNLTSDPVRRVTRTNKVVTTFALAFNERNTQDPDDVIYVDCEAWESHAEAIAKHCVRGTGLFVEGKLKLKRWTEQASGSKRQKLIVVVNEFKFVRRAASQASAGASAADGAAGKSPAPPPAEDGDTLDDVPF